MGKTASKLNVIADCQEPAVLVPVVLEPIEVQVPLVSITPQLRDVAIAVPVPPDRAVMYDVSSSPLSFEYSWDCIVSGIQNSLIHRTESIHYLRTVRSLDRELFRPKL